MNTDITKEENENTTLNTISISKSKFIEEFICNVSGYMYKYCDPYDYSCGMEEMDKNEIKEIGSDLYDSLYVH